MDERADGVVRALFRRAGTKLDSKEGSLKNEMRLEKKGKTVESIRP